MSQAKKEQKPVSFQDAVRIQSAEFWLRLGQPREALGELQRLPRRLWDHPSVRLVLHRLCKVR
jgi:hypothetical protein